MGAISMMASRSATTAPSTSAAVVSRLSEKRSTAALVVDADRLEHVVRAARPRRAGRARRGIDPARLQRVQHRLGGQPRERQRADVRHARRAAHRRLRLGEGAQVRERRQHLALQSIPLAAHAIRRVRVAVGGDQARRPRPGRRTRAGSRFPNAARALAGRRPTAAPGARPAASRARPSPLARGTCGPRWPACRRPGSPRVAGRNPIACTPSTCRCGRCGCSGALRASPCAISAIGWMVPSSLLTSMTATTAVSGRTAATTSTAATTPEAAGRHHRQLVALADQHLGGAQDRGVLDRGDDQVAPARARGRADQAQRIGLGAAAGEQDLRRRRRAQQLRDLLARLLDGARRRRAQRVRRRRIREQVARRARHRLQHFGRGLRRCGVVQINHLPSIYSPRARPVRAPWPTGGFCGNQKGWISAAVPRKFCTRSCPSTSRPARRSVRRP